MDVSQRERHSMLAVKVGLVMNVLLAILKTSVSSLGHSPALLADGINSTSDEAYYLVVVAFMKRAGKPSDYEHPYGRRPDFRCRASASSRSGGFASSPSTPQDLAALRCVLLAP